MLCYHDGLTVALLKPRAKYGLFPLSGFSQVFGHSIEKD